jgi:hypothetical protein
MIILIFILILSAFGKKTSHETSGEVKTSHGSGFLTTIIVLFFLFLIILGVFHFFFGIDVILNLNRLFEKKITLEAIEPDKKGPLLIPIPLIHKEKEKVSDDKQVFNIPGNNYTFEQADILCKAYGADLASYNEIENSYNKGSNWCNYGWSQGQMALFPTQQKTFDDLQKIKGHEHDCGRPGINGGYIANPEVKFGVNCFGKKPKITDDEKILMDVSEEYPNGAEAIMLDKRVEYWKKQLPNILVSPFNSTTWSKV